MGVSGLYEAYIIKLLESNNIEDPKHFICFNFAIAADCGLCRE